MSGANSWVSQIIHVPRMFPNTMSYHRVVMPGPGIGDYRVGAPARLKAVFHSHLCLWATLNFSHLRAWERTAATEDFCHIALLVVEGAWGGANCCYTALLEVESACCWANCYYTAVLEVEGACGWANCCYTAVLEV